jgi:bacteriophage exclusion system BrxC/D-like protein
MTATITPSNWVEFIRREYLEEFIREGGAAIKFCVALEDQTRSTTWEAAELAAKQSGYIVAKIDASTTKVNLVEQLFFRIAQQIDWQALAERVIRRLCERESYIPPKASQRPSYERVAEQNGINSEIVKINLERALSQEVAEHPELAKDFRTAMTQLCLAQMRDGDDAPLITQVLIEWLTGRSPTINAVRRNQIFNRIIRTNARRMLESLLRWTVMAGFSGTVILLDLTRLAVAKNPRDDRVYYSTSMLYDTFEVLREFIDSADRLTHCLFVVFPDLSFLDNTSRRGMAIYEALQFRIDDDVRARELVNPMAALVRVSNKASEVYPG